MVRLLALAHLVCTSFPLFFVTQVYAYVAQSSYSAITAILICNITMDS
jgi:hypothetical protein